MSEQWSREQSCGRQARPKGLGQMGRARAGQASERGRRVPRRLSGGGEHREGLLGVMFWLGSHVGMTLLCREGGESIS